MKSSDELIAVFCKEALKKFIIILVTSFLIAVLFLVSNKEEHILQNGNILYRPSYNENEKEVTIKAGVESIENAKNVTLQIEPEKYTLEEFETVVIENIPSLEKEILDINLSAEEITDNLKLPTLLMDTPIKIRWESEAEEIVKTDGTVNRKYVSGNGSTVGLSAIFTYEDYKMVHTICLFVKPEKLSDQEILHNKLLEKMKDIFESSQTNEKIELPKEIEGKKVFYEEEIANKTGIIFIFFIMGVLIWFILLKDGLEKQEKKREQQLIRDYPELISQFTLLLSAGMTISGAWTKLVSQYEKNQRRNEKERRYLYEEMVLTLREIKNGVSEVEAISDFGNRIKLTPYLKFSSLLSQNIRKGSRGLTELLREEGKLAYEERKENAKQLGEEAGTKLLLPMIIMLSIVLVIILVPSFLSF